MPDKKFRTIQDVIDSLGETWDKLDHNEDMDPQRAKAFVEIAKTTLIALEKQHKLEGGSKDKLDAEKMLEIMMRGLSAGVARELLQSRDFKQLELRHSEMVTVETVQAEKMILDRLGVEKLEPLEIIDDNEDDTSIGERPGQQEPGGIYPEGSTSPAEVPDSGADFF